jgi:ribA/ribD-fused uncharacterized protein
MIYNISQCCVFHKTKEANGELSNMAAGFKLVVNGIAILTSEALYQACRFPSRPDVQEIIIAQASPMRAKMKGRPHRLAHTRADWDDVRVDIMRWSIRVKLAQNFESFSTVLRSSGQKTIVEKSHQDGFWGAVQSNENSDILEGENMLGKLLMELREELYTTSNPSKFLSVEPLDIPDFLLYGEPIGKVIGKVG